MKKAKAKATAGAKELAAVVESVAAKKGKQRREFKDDYFVFEGQENGGDKQKDEKR